MASNPSKRPSSSITLHYDLSSSLLSAGLLPFLLPKKLRRLPHLFCRVLELPLHSDSPVRIEESQNGFTFAISLPGLVPEHVRAEIIEILPGITKIVIGGADRFRAVLDELEILPWRFRLPPCSVPEAASAAYDDGVLVVTVPKASVSPSDGLPVDRPSLELGKDAQSTGGNLRSDSDSIGSSTVSGAEKDSAIPSSAGDVEPVGSLLEDSGMQIGQKMSFGGVDKDSVSVIFVIPNRVIAEAVSLHSRVTGDEEVRGRPISVH